MGTSAGYSLPTGGNWSKVKREVTTWVSSGATDRDSVGHVVSGYVGAHGGGRQAAQQMSHATRAGSRLAGFVGSVAQNGLAETLRGLNLGEYIGRSATEVLRGLRSYLLGDGSLIEDDIVQNAYMDFYEEQLDGDESFEGLETLLRQTDIGTMLVRFFGHCIYRQFLLQFHERMMRKVDIPTTQRLLGLVKDYIFTKLRLVTHEKDLSAVDWNGGDGEALSGQILQSALEFMEANNAD
nr:hypothetical protein [Nitrosomonas nitrosa]